MPKYYTKQGLKPPEGEEGTVGQSVGKVAIPFHSSREGLKISIKGAKNYVVISSDGNELKIDDRDFAKVADVATLDIYDTEAILVRYCQQCEIEGFANG